MRKAILFLLAICVVAVQAAGGGATDLVAKAWDILKEVNTRFVQEDMQDTFLHDCTTYYKVTAFEDQMATDPVRFEDEAQKIAFHVIHFQSDWDEGVVRAAVTSNHSLMYDLSLNTVGIEIIVKEYRVDQENDLTEYDLLIGISQALIDDDLNEIRQELQKTLNINEIDSKAQELADMYSTKSAHSFMSTGRQEILSIPGFQILILPGVERQTYSTELDFLEDENLEENEVCAVGCDEGQFFEESPSPTVQYNNKLYVTVVLRTVTRNP